MGTFSTQKILTWERGSFFFTPLLLLWLVRILAELNRTPFDLSEGESELVSGFNTEFRSVKFAVFFMAEYLIIISLRRLTVILFFQFFFSFLRAVCGSVVIIRIVINSRATFPRVRYDSLIEIA